MDKSAVLSLFDRYERLFNAALDGKADLKAISDLYESAFLGAAPAGVMTGVKGPELDKAMIAGFERSRAIGNTQMAVQRVQVDPIDEMHAMARVDWRATYDTRSVDKVIEFTNVYLTREDAGQAKVFAWITGDEEATLRERGIRP